MLRPAGKAVQFAACSAAFMSASGLGRTLLPRQRSKRAFGVRAAQQYSKALLKVFNIHVSLLTPLPPRIDDRPFFVVSNHVSDLDVLILYTLMPLVFVTSVEVQNTLFSG